LATRSSFTARPSGDCDPVGAGKRRVRDFDCDNGLGIEPAFQQEVFSLSSGCRGRRAGERAGPRDLEQNRAARTEGDLESRAMEQWNDREVFVARMSDFWRDVRFGCGCFAAAGFVLAVALLLGSASAPIR